MIVILQAGADAVISSAMTLKEFDFDIRTQEEELEFRIEEVDKN
jgi:hypothetical protein